MGSIGRSRILGILTGVRRATSASSSARAGLITKPWLRTRPPNGSGQAMLLKRWWCEPRVHIISFSRGQYFLLLVAYAAYNCVRFFFSFFLCTYFEGDALTPRSDNNYMW